jgi:hypothetical protein
MRLHEQISSKIKPWLQREKDKHVSTHIFALRFWTIPERQWGTKSATSCDQLTASIGDLLVSGRPGYTTSRGTLSRRTVLSVGVIKAAAAAARNDTFVQALAGRHDAWSRWLYVPVMSTGLATERHRREHRNLCSFRESRTSLTGRPTRNLVTVLTEMSRLLGNQDAENWYMLWRQPQALGGYTGAYNRRLILSYSQEVRNRAGYDLIIDKCKVHNTSILIWKINSSTWASLVLHNVGPWCSIKI